MLAPDEKLRLVPKPYLDAAARFTNGADTPPRFSRALPCRSRRTRANFRNPDMAHRDQTAWLGWEDSNSEMSSQIIPLKDRTDLRESSRILALKTIRV